MIKKLIIMMFVSFIFLNIYSQSSINEKLDEQDDLIQSLENEMHNVRIMVNYLQQNNDELNGIIDKCNLKINELMENIESMKKALISNKEDTSEVIDKLTNAYNELEHYKSELMLMKKKNRNANIFVQSAIPLVTLPVICYGAYDYYHDKNEKGKTTMIIGISGLLGGELIWNCGKFIFKLW